MRDYGLLINRWRVLAHTAQNSVGGMGYVSPADCIEVMEALTELRDRSQAVWRVGEKIHETWGYPDLKSGIATDLPGLCLKGICESVAEATKVLALFRGHAFLKWSRNRSMPIEVQVMCDRTTLLALQKLVRQNNYVLSPEIVAAVVDD